MCSSDLFPSHDNSGEIGIVVLGLKTLDGIAVGDTMTDAKNPTKMVVDGFEPAKPFVFAGLYPIETDKFEDLREALNKLKLNDSSISFEPESSMAQESIINKLSSVTY